VLLSRLQAIVDVDSADRAGWAPADLARAFLDGGARFLQIRAKHLGSAAFLELCDIVVTAAAGYGAAVIVNDRADLAVASRAAGVHVGQDDLPPGAVRRIVGDRAIVGWSTHEVAQIEAAAREPLSYVAVGPVFGTRTKETGYEPVGIELVRTAHGLAGDVPVVAIGGITLDAAPSVIAAGAACVAVIGDLLAGDDPAARVRAYVDVLDGRIAPGPL
jgi:thiamine-phosphate pyrophosphorylase